MNGQFEYFSYGFLKEFAHCSEVLRKPVYCVHLEIEYQYMVYSA